MTQFTQKSFSVPVGGRKRDACEHGMARTKDGQCCFCGATEAEVLADIRQRIGTPHGVQVTKAG